MTLERGPALVAMTAAALLLGSCNAVFGLEDRSFGTGGGGGAGGDGGGSTTTATGGAGSTSSTSSGGTCAPQDIARAGDFDPGWEGSWTGFDLDLSIEDGDGQPVLRATVAGAATEGVLTNVPATAPTCSDACLRATFSFFANTDFQLYVFVENDAEALRIGLVDLTVSATGTFETVQSGVACRLPDGVDVIDRLMFQAIAPGDFLLDDVVLEVTECAAEAPACDVLD